MKKFRNFRSALNETASQVNEGVVDSFTVGKDKLKAEIQKKGSNYVAKVDGEELDEFRSEREARKGIDDFVKLMDI